MAQALNKHEDQVTIIMRTCRRPIFLARAVQSVLDQEHAQWQLVVVNDGPAADAGGVIERFAERLQGRVQVMQSAGSGTPPCIGRLTNEGLRASDGRWITVLDDDDTWDPAFLRRTVGRLSDARRHPQVRGVATQSLIVEDQVGGGILTEGPTRTFNPGFCRVDLLSLAAANLFTSNSFVYERSALEQAGYYDETLPVLDDWDFNLRFARKFEIDVIAEPLARYHRRTATDASPAHRNTPDPLHDFYHNKIINDRLRSDLDSGSTGLGWLMALSGRLKSMSEKIGKIEQRTRELRNPRTRD